MLSDRMHARPAPATLRTPRTPSRRREASNRAALLNLIARAATLAAVRAAMATRPPHSRAALALRGDLTARLDAALDPAPDAVFVALSEVKAAMVRDLTARAVMLPNLRLYRPPGALPALALAHRLHGDDPRGLIARADDLIARNPAIIHPGLVPADLAIEVLDD